MNLETIIVAVLSFLGTALGTFSGFKLTTYRVEQLEKKVDKHNNFAERIPIIENKVQNLEHEVNVLEQHLN
jgi:hypothetical protein